MMDFSRTGSRFLLLAAVALGVLSGWGEEKRRYSELVKAIRLVSERNHVPVRDVAFKVQSSKKGVSTSDIRFLILSRQGTISIAPNAAGLFSFPLREDLLAENPVVTTNQEPGSVEMSIELKTVAAGEKGAGWADRIADGTVTRIRFFDLMSKALGREIRSLADIEAVQTSLLGTKSDGMGVFVVLSLGLPLARETLRVRDGERIVEISPTVTKAGEKRYRLVLEGADKQILDANPWIETPVVPWETVTRDAAKGDEYAIIAKANAIVYGLYSQPRDARQGVQELGALAEGGSEAARAALNDVLVRETDAMHPETALAALAAKADPDAAGHDGRTALIAAANGGLAAVVDALLAAGANANAATREGETALMLAAAAGHGEVVKALLAAKADVNATRVDGANALNAAAHGGHVGIAKALLAAKADPNAATADGTSSLMLAAHGGSGELVGALLAGGADVNAARPGDGVTALGLAASAGHGDVASRLLAAGAKADAVTKDGSFPLLAATDGGHAGVAKALLGAKADVNARGPESISPLWIAALRGHDEILGLLLAAGADANAAADGGRTPLMAAAVEGHAQIVGALLAGGAKANAATTNGKTALMLAANGGHAKVVEALLAAKADVDAKDRRGNTALALALRRNHQDIAAMLRAAQPKPPTQAPAGEKGE